VPPILTPLLARFIITSGSGYLVLFDLCSAIAMIGAALVNRVHAAR
jgi:hypothetical protein